MSISISQNVARTAVAIAALPVMFGVGALLGEPPPGAGKHNGIGSGELLGAGIMTGAIGGATMLVGRGTTTSMLSRIGGAAYVGSLAGVTTLGVSLTN